MSLDDTSILLIERLYVERGLEFTSPFEGIIPVQAYGYLDGLRFYFRSRGEVSLSVGPYHLPSEARRYDDHQQDFDKAYKNMNAASWMSSEKKAHLENRMREMYLDNGQYEEVMPTFITLRANLTDTPLPESPVDYGEEISWHARAFLHLVANLKPNYDTIEPEARLFVPRLAADFNVQEDGDVVVRHDPKEEPRRVQDLVTLYEPEDKVNAYGEVVRVEGDLLYVRVNWQTFTDDPFNGDGHP